MALTWEKDLFLKEIKKFMMLLRENCKIEEEFNGFEIKLKTNIANSSKKLIFEGKFSIQ